MDWGVLHRRRLDGLGLVAAVSDRGLLLGPVLLVVSVFTGPDPGNLLFPVLLGYGFVFAERFSGRSAWVAGLPCVAYLLGLVRHHR